MSNRDSCLKNADIRTFFGFNLLLFFLLLTTALKNISRYTIDGGLMRYCFDILDYLDILYCRFRITIDSCVYFMSLKTKTDPRASQYSRFQCSLLTA